MRWANRIEAVTACSRRAPGEVVAPYRQRRDGPELAELRSHLAGWVLSVLAELGDAMPELPVEDRAADTWESFVAIGDLAGGDWPERIRRACKVLVAAARGRQLRVIDAAPWGDFFGGQLTPRALARMLKPYDVRPRDVWIAGTTRKGYRLDNLSDVWARYLPALPGSGEADARSARCACGLRRGDVPERAPARLRRSARALRRARAPMPSRRRLVASPVPHHVKVLADHRPDKALAVLRDDGLIRSCCATRAPILCA